MSHLIQLREQIKTIQTTRKITHAVRLVSMSLYGKLEKKNTLLGNYCSRLVRTYSLLRAQKPSWQNATFYPQDSLDSKPLIIIIATTKGLCGSLNANLFRNLEQTNFIGEHQSPSYIVVGLRAIKFFKQHNIGPVIHSYAELNSNNYSSIADDLMSKITTNTPAYSSVVFYSNILKTFFTQQCVRQTLIPLPSLQSNELENDSERYNDIIWEQEPDTILTKVATKYAHSFIINILFQALLAEHAARFLAMDTSTSNADNYLERLMMDYNKTRQYLITREVAELTAI